MNTDTQADTQDGLQVIHAEPMPMATDEIAKLESEIANLSARWSDAIATENPAPQDRVWQITCQWNGFAPSFIVSHQGGIHWRVMDEFTTLADAMRCLKGKLNEAVMIEEDWQTTAEYTDWKEE